MDFFAPQKEVSKAEKELRPLLFDDGCQILSSFELNKIASLTYGDIVCDEIFELIESIVAQPMNHSTLTVQKTLVVLKHILIYGSAKCVNSGYGIGKFVESLTTFNTVLAAQQQQGATAFLQRLQGGGVDRGGPIREAALQVQKLLLNINDLQRIRNESASADSLVPIGDEKVAFITDEVRHFLLKRRIEKQERIEIKSNLAKSQGGFGAGYSAKDGKNVVGAAHGIEEMLKMAKRGKSKFTDDENMHGPSPEDKILEELAAEAKREKELVAQAAAARNVALLDVEGTNAPKPSGGDFDLLDFGSQVQSPAVPGLQSTTDLLSGFGNTNSGGTGETNDLLGLSGGMSQNTSDLVSLTAGGLGAGGGDGLFGLPQTSHMQSSSLTVDPFAPVASTSQPSMAPASLYATDLGGMMRNMSLGSTSLMPSNEDRFAALDALAELPGAQASIPSSNSFLPTMGGPQLPTIQSMVTPGSGHVAPTYGDAREGNSGNDNPWVMGGSAGTGLDPLAPAPAVPPPPLPTS